LGSRTNLADIARRSGDLEAAERHARDALPLHRRVGDRVDTVSTLGLLAVCAAGRNDVDQAGARWGAAEAEAERLPFSGGWDEARQELEPMLDAVAGAAFDQAVARGRGMTLDEAIDHVLADVD